MDYLLKALALKEQIRVYLVKNSDIVNETIKRHDLWPSAASVLGKTFSIALMMGAMLKNDQALTIKINGNGPIGNIIVDCNSEGVIRGYVDHPHVNFVNNKGGLDDLAAIGDDGYIDVIKDLKLKDLFTSTIATTGDLAQDFTYYFMESEQTPSAIALGILIEVDNTCKVSGGLLIQLMPNAREEAITYLENKLKNISSISVLLENNSLEQILEILFENDFKILENKKVFFHCPCSKEAFAKGLITLGKEELNTILEEDKQIEAVCHYCGEKYLFTETEIKELIKEIKK